MMNFGLDDIMNNTFFGVPLEELKPYAKKLQEEYNKTQNNGCLSCNGDEWYFNRWCWIDDKGDTCHIVIKYCPICGRELV